MLEDHFTTSLINKVTLASNSVTQARIVSHRASYNFLRSGGGTVNAQAWLLSFNWEPRSRPLSRASKFPRVFSGRNASKSPRESTTPRQSPFHFTNHCNSRAQLLGFHKAGWQELWKTSFCGCWPILSSPPRGHANKRRSIYSTRRAIPHFLEVWRLLQPIRV